MDSEELMGANEELRLITKIVDEGELRPVLDAGIGIGQIKIPRNRLMFEFILDYWNGRRTSGEIPTRELMEKKFRSEELGPEERLSLKAVVEEFQTYDIQRRLSNLSDYITDNQKALSPDKVLAKAYQEIQDLAKVRRVTQDAVLSDVLAEAEKRYDDRRNNEVLEGIPYPWEILNEESQGMRDDDFIVFYGRPKSMKTWVLLKIAVHAYDYGNRRVLIYTREMGLNEMVDRVLCLLIGAPYDALRKGRLHEYPTLDGKTMEYWFKQMLKSLKGDEKTCSIDSGYNKGIIITTDREDRQGGGVSGLRQKISDHEPDLVCVDAIYLMRDDKAGMRSVKWENQATITHDLRDLNLDVRRPFVITTQATRASEDRKGQAVSNIAYSDAVGQDCTMAAEILKKKISDEQNELAIAITAAREMNLTGFAINGNPGTDFSMLYRKARDSAGLPIPDPKTGEALMVPHIFEDLFDIKEMFKEADEKKKADTNKARSVGASREDLQKSAAKFAKSQRHHA